LKWIGSIFKKQDPQDHALVLPLSGVNSWLEQKSKSPEFEKTIKDIYSEIGSIAEDLDKNMNALRYASANESTPPRLLNAGLAARDALQNHVEGLSEKLAPPTSMGIDVASKYHSMIVKSLGNTVFKFGSSQRYAAALFPKEAENIKHSFNRLSHHLVDLNDAIDKGQNLQRKINESRELGTKIQDEIFQIRLLSKNLEDIEKKLEGLLALQKKTTTDLQELKSSDKGHEIMALKEMLDKKRHEMIKIEAQMARLVSPMTKALTRLVKQDSSDRLELQHKGAFELLFRSPQEALNSDISGALRELQSSVDLLGLKDKKREKILEHIGRLIKDRPLEVLKAQHSEILHIILNLDRELSSSSHDMMALEEVLKQTPLLIEKQKLNLDQIRKSISSIEDKASKDKTQLEAMLEKIAGQPLTVDIEN
jgi:predicted  nucleic acid-binding Zn-ribbon protein